MAKLRNIPPADRTFLQLVSQAAFTNPFSVERAELDRCIAGAVGGAGPDEVQGRAIRQVGNKVAELRSNGLGHLRHFSGEDLALMRTVFLFEAFYRYMEPFDRLIDEQTMVGDAPCTVGFAAECLGLLGRRGFPGEEARRFFSLFYQLRRAYYFIQRGLVGDYRRHGTYEAVARCTGLDRRTVKKHVLAASEGAQEERT
jgi:hypothetical protein